eukprot:4386373-Prymnesium_polylepis.2
MMTRRNPDPHPHPNPHPNPDRAGGRPKSDPHLPKVEVGRHCEDELASIGRYADLKGSLDELAAHKAALLDAGRPTAGDLTWH